MKRFATSLVLLFCACHLDTGNNAAPVDVTISPGETDFSCDESTRVTLDLLGENIVSITATDIMFVLDESGSVGSSGFSQMKDFVRAVISNLATEGLFDNGGSVGIAMFSGEAGDSDGGDGRSRLVLPLSSDTSLINATLNNLNSQGGATCIGCGLNESTDEFIASSATGNKRIAIVITDGANNRPSGVFGDPDQHLADAVAAADAASVERFAIGVRNADDDDLEAIASGSDHVFQVQNFSQINLILGQLVAAVVTPGSTDVVVSATVSSHFTISNVTTTLGSATAAGNDITWTIAELGEETATIAYDITHSAAFGGGVEAVHSAISFTDNEGNAVSFPDLTVNVHGCPASVSLSPTTATVAVGGSVTLTADVDDDFGDPVAGVDVLFDVTAGPNAGANGTNATDAGGEASFSYTSNNVMGTDSVLASFVRGADTISSAPSSIEWADVVPPTVECVPSVNQPPHAQGSPPPPNGKNGFFKIIVSDDFDADPEVYVGGFGAFFDQEIIKITVAPGTMPKRLPMGGAAVAHLLFDSDPIVIARDSSGNTAMTTCF